MSGGKASSGGVNNSRASSRMGPVVPGGPSPTPGQLRPHGDSVLSVAPSPPVPMFPPGIQGVDLVERFE